MTQNTKVILGVVLGAVIIALSWNAYDDSRLQDCCSTEILEQFRDTNPTNEQASTTPPAGQKCAAQGGTWSEVHKECTKVSSEACSSIGGTYAECESPCRHDPDVQACIMMCVAVCKF